MGDDPRASEKRITATTRQLENLIRLSEAHVRMPFSEFVELADVKEASRLMREAIRTSAMDPRTGKIDTGLLNTGMGSGQRKMREDMRKELLSILDGVGKGRGIKWEEAMKILGEQSSVKVDAVDFAEVIKGWRMRVLLRSLARGRRGPLRGLRDGITESYCWYWLSIVVLQTIGYLLYSSHVYRSCFTTFDSFL